uniref:Importin-5 n=1 Tax=Macrostomum lignano TaxID=282301 RepID=A0A1I8IFD4_9PLAT
MVEHGDFASNSLNNHQSDFCTLLNGLQSMHNEERTNAETQYEQIPAQTRLGLLLQSMSTGQTTELRSFSAVLLRRLLVKNLDEAYEQLNPTDQASVRQQLLLCVTNEPDASVRRKAADAAAEMARNIGDVAASGNDSSNACGWPEFVQLAAQCVHSGQPATQQIGLHLLAQVPSAFSHPASLPLVHQLLGKAVSDAGSAAVRSAGVKAACAFLVANEEEEGTLNQMRDLLPPMLRGLAESIVTPESDDASGDEDAVLKGFVELAEVLHKWLRPQLTELIELCVQTVGNQQLPDSRRHLALELVVTLSENAAASVRKAGAGKVGALVQQVLMLMTDLEDDPEWALQENKDEDDDDESNAINGETALDRLCCGLGGKAMLPHILELVPHMLRSPTWQHRHAALMAVSACGEGCHAQMESMLDNVLVAVLPFFQDPHPRVRYACCNAVGQMCTDFGKIMPKKFHAQIVPNLLRLFDDYANREFSESCPKSILTIYLDSLISKLEQILSTKFQELVQKGNKMVVTTLASVADTAEEKFIQYYDKFMPCLKYIMENAVQKELSLLRGKTIECISLIGLAVGKEKFLADASAVMQMLLRTQTDHPLAEDDPQMTYMISAWARMCKIMGREFEPYLPLVMGPVMKAAEIKPEVCIMDSEEVQNAEQDPEWQFIKLADEQNFAIKTSGLEDKANACQMLVCYARELREAFAPYTEQVAQLMVPLLKFYFHDEVRSAACESLPHLLECARSQGPTFLGNLWGYIRPSLIAAIGDEPEPEVQADGLSSLAQCIEAMGAGCLADSMDPCLELLEKLLNSHFEKAEKRQAAREDDEYVLSRVADVLHSLLSAYKQQFEPQLQRLLPLIAKLLDESRSWLDWQWGVCIFDDVIEHLGPASFRYQEVFLPRLVSSAVHKEPDLRQAALLAGRSTIDPQPDDAVPGTADRSPRLAATRTICTENAIAAATKILKHCPAEVAGQPPEQILPMWLSWLPVSEDREETEHVYGFLCDLIERNDPNILGPNNQNVPRILAIIGECLYREALDEDKPTAARIVAIARQVLANPEAVKACWPQLTEQQQAALQSRVASQ